MVRKGKRSLLVAFVEVRFPQGLHDEGILLLAHKLGQRVGQGAPVALFTQGVQQDPCQVLGRHLAEREGLRLRYMLAFPIWPECPPSTSANVPTLPSAIPLGGPLFYS